MSCCGGNCGTLKERFAAAGSLFPSDEEDGADAQGLLGDAAASKRRPCRNACLCCGCSCCSVCVLVLAFLILNGISLPALWAAMHGQPQSTANWIGPDKEPGELWGGPSLEWANQKFVDKVVPTDGIEQHMNWAGKGSAVPEGLHGVFWIDQAGKSSIAKDPKYTYNWPVAAPELVATFGEGEAQFQESSKCVTPIPFYGGLNWAAINNTRGSEMMDFHFSVRNTASFCFSDSTMDNIQLQMKALADKASWGPITFGPVVARLLGFQDAGDGYLWTSLFALNMTMVKHEWGWDRETHIFELPTCKWPLRSLLVSLLPESSLKTVLASGTFGVGHYPVVQIVDGNGERTKYYKEFLEFMSNKPGGDHMLLRVPA